MSNSNNNSIIPNITTEITNTILIQQQQQPILATTETTDNLDSSSDENENNPFSFLDDLLLSLDNDDDEPTIKYKPCPTIKSSPPDFLREIKLISFDLDDTLWHCYPVLSKAEDDMIRHLAAHDQQVANLYVTKKGLLQREIEKAHPTRLHHHSFIRKEVIRTAAIRLQREDSYAERLSHATFQVFYTSRSAHVSAHLFPGAVDSIKRLREYGFEIGSVTNGNANVKLIEELKDLIDYPIVAEHYQAPKPDPSPFLALLATAHGGNFKPHEVLHVGDAIDADVKGAKAVGMRTCWIGKGTVPRDADLAFSSVEELTCYLLDALSNSNSNNNNNKEENISVSTTTTLSATSDD
jgi:HAD superfamily hydrolase (TIGR01509 family)